MSLSCYPSRVSQVATVRTDATPGEVLGAIKAALPDAPQMALAIIAAQSGVETANWSPDGFKNFNLGNITVGPNSSQDWMVQGSNPLHFAAYSSLKEGAQAMVDWLRTRGALGAAYAGSVANYVGALRRGCYLGCVGQGSTTEQDYINYEAGINARLPRLLATTPILPQSLPKQLIAAGAILAVAGATAYAIDDSLFRAAWRKLKRLL